MHPILEFRGETKWLSNFFGGEVVHEGLRYRNAEAAFQAAKNLDKSARVPFTKMSASEAKAAGGKNGIVKLRDDWEKIKDQVMYDITLDKFIRNESSRKLLLKTEDAPLEEGNHHGDKIWGTVDGVGENRLGKILMKVRSKLQSVGEYSMVPLCLYHSVDFDGVLSGAIFNRFLPDCELYGFNYGDKFPWTKLLNPYGVKRDVYLADISMSKDDMVLLDSLCNLIWIDHHKTAIDQMNGVFINGIREIGTAACELVWNWFNPENGLVFAPDVVKLVGSYDVWRKNGSFLWEDVVLPFQGWLKFNAGVYDPTNVLWNDLLSDSKGLKTFDGVKIGRYIYEFQKQQCEMIAKERAFETQLNGHKCLAINSPLHSSMSLEHLFDTSNHEMMIVFSYTKFKLWRVSLYTTRNDVDCGKVAKEFGGGGHVQAAGFETKDLPFPM